jgi:hypothetical protein
MNIGKLYQAKKFYWFLYPSKDITVAALVARRASLRAAALTHAFAKSFSARYSERVNCNVSYISPNSVFVLLEQDGEFIKILTMNGEVGWIYLAERYKDDIEEVNQ